MKRLLNSALLRILISLFLVASTFIAVAQPARAATISLSESEYLKFNRANGVTNIVGTGKANGDIVLYKNVGTFGGVTIDAAIETNLNAAEATITDYDANGSAQTTGGYLDNFQINMNTTSSSAVVGGTVEFTFSFYEAGTYTGRNTGIPVTLQNVKVTSIDLDSSGTNGYQFSDFTGFQKYQMMNPTNLSMTPKDNPARVRFQATKTGARSSVPEDQVLVKYDSISSMKVTFGNVTESTTNYYGLVFGGWPNGGNPVEYQNSFNIPPTSSATQTYVPTGTATVLNKTVFGNYQDEDLNPFNKVRIDTLPATGTLQYLSGASWVSVQTGQEITIADIELGKLRFSGTADTSFNFSVQDGLDYSVSSYGASLVVATSNQVIAFPNPGAKAPSLTPFPSSATSDSGLPVTLTSSTPGVCTVDGLNIIAVAVGTCVITATQSGNATYGAAQPVTQTFPVDSRTPQTITFTNPGPQTFSTNPITPSVSASSGLTVTLTSLTPGVCTISADGTKIVMVGVGVCNIRATQAGNGTYTPAPPVDISFLINAGAPLATTLAATSVTGTSATLNGTIDAVGTSTTVTFCYSLSSTTTAGALSNCLPSGAVTATPGSLSTSGSTSVSYSATGLTTNTTYYFQVIATNSTGTTYGSVLNFLATSVTKPTATTLAVTSLSSTGATLSGYVAANGAAFTSVKFCYTKTNTVSAGVLQSCTTTPNSGNATGTPAGASDTGNVSTGVSNLSKKTTYYYQVIGTTAQGTTYGAVLKFTTGGSSATTTAATDVLTTSATLNGSVKPSSSSSATSIKFCYSLSNASINGVMTDCIKTVNANPSSVTTTSSTSASIGVTGLDPSRTYYFQIIAIYGTSRTNYGDILSFTTQTPPPVTPTATTLAATSVLATTATLNGFVNANGTDSAVTFCYSTSNTVSAGALTSCIATPTASPGVASGTTNTSASTSVSGLTQGTTYYFQIIGSKPGAGNIQLVNYGEVFKFTAGAPQAVTSSATSISATRATLNGSVKTQGGSSDISFCYGTSSSAANGVLASCTTIAGSPSVTTAVSAKPSSVAITGLTPGQTYYFQIIGTKNISGNNLISYGEIISFIASEPPTVTTIAASSVSASGATLNGTINSNGATTAVTFCYSTSNKVADNLLTDCIAIPTATPSSISGATNGNNSVSKVLTGLTAGTTYYFQVIGDNRQGTASGEVLSFTTSPTAPAVTTKSPGVGSTTATLNGVVNAKGAATANKFCYSLSGTTSNGALSNCISGQLTASPSSSTGTNDTDVSVGISGLTANTTYYYQVIGVNSVGTTYGLVVSFKAGAPGATTVSASSVGSTTATLYGNISSNGADTTVEFCYSSDDTQTTLGILDACSTKVTATTNSSVLGTNNAQVAATYNATGLTQGTTYYFQILGRNSRGTSYGNILTFSPGGPTTTTNPATNVNSNSAKLNGSINWNNVSNTTGKFCYGTSPSETAGSLDECTLVDSSPADITSDAVIEFLLTGLSGGTKYYFQAIGDNPNGTNYGKILFFTTDPTPLATTGSATSVTQSGATLNGSATAELTDPFFCYSSTRPITSFDPQNCQIAVGSGTLSSYTASISGLAANTNYYFQIFGKRDGEWVNGAINEFITNAVAASSPSVTTDPATNVTKTSAKLNGTGIGNGSQTTVKFCLTQSSARTGGTLDACFGNNPTVTPIDADESPITGNNSNPIKRNVNGLTKGKKYYVQVVGNNVGGTSYGSIQEFTTLDDEPSVTPTPTPSTAAVVTPTPTPTKTTKRNNNSTTLTVAPKPTPSPSTNPTPQAIPTPKAKLPEPVPAVTSTPIASNGVNTVDLGNGTTANVKVNPNSPTAGLAPNEITSAQRSVTELASEKISGFAPGSGLRIDVFGARTTAQFVVTPGTAADPIAVTSALKESQNRKTTNFANITDARPTSTPADEEIIGGNPTEDALEAFTASDLGEPVTVGSLKFKADSKWIKVNASVTTYKPGSIVYLAVTTDPVIFGAAQVDKFGKADFAGYLPIDVLASGGHNIRVVGIRELDGVTTNENGEVVLADETLSEIKKFDEGTKSTVKISGENTLGGTNLVVRVIPLEKVKPWWTVWLVAAISLLLTVARRFRKVSSKKARLSGQIIAGLSALPGLILGWFSSSYDVMGLAALIGAIGMLAVVFIPQRHLKTQK